MEALRLLSAWFPCTLLHHCHLLYLSFRKGERKVISFGPARAPRRTLTCNPRWYRSWEDFPLSNLRKCRRRSSEERMNIARKKGKGAAGPQSNRLCYDGLRFREERAPELRLHKVEGAAAAAAPFPCLPKAACGFRKREEVNKNKNSYRMPRQDVENFLPF